MVVPFSSLEPVAMPVITVAGKTARADAAHADADDEDDEPVPVTLGGSLDDVSFCEHRCVAVSAAPLTSQPAGASALTGDKLVRSAASARLACLVWLRLIPISRRSSPACATRGPRRATSAV